MAIDLIKYEQSSRMDEYLHHCLGTMACHAAVRAQRKLALSLAELDKLFLRGR